MQLQLTTIHDDETNTIGVMRIDGELECFTLEDAFNEPKIYGKTRIPRGSYEIGLRNEGTMTTRYAKRFPNHKGMLWLKDVPNFKYVYIHIGNDEDDTDGCILLGNNWDMRTGKITGSTLAYSKLYDKVVKAMLDGYPINIEII